MHFLAGGKGEGTNNQYSKGAWLKRESGLHSLYITEGSGRRGVMILRERNRGLRCPMRTIASLQIKCNGGATTPWLCIMNKLVSYHLGWKV